MLREKKFLFMPDNNENITKSSTFFIRQSFALCIKMAKIYLIISEIFEVLLAKKKLLKISKKFLIRFVEILSNSIVKNELLREKRII